jgi:hypothetical protein
MNPVVYLGQSSCGIGFETRTLCKKERLHLSPSVSVDSNPSRSDVLDVNMPNLFSYPSEGSRNVDAIVNQIIKKMEICDNPSGLGIVADLCSGTGSSLSNAIITDIKDIAPNLRLQSIFINPPYHTMHGIDIINGIMSLQISLEYADCVMLRGIDDALVLANENRSSSSPSPSLNDALNVIAADMYCALGPRKVNGNDIVIDIDSEINSGGIGSNDTFYNPIDEYSYSYNNNSKSSDNEMNRESHSLFNINSTGTGTGSDISELYCWPSSPCSNIATNKLCDVRTSLWRYHDCNEKIKSKGKGISKSVGSNSSSSNGKVKAENYNPLRALASNMHSLHTSSEAISLFNDIDIPDNNSYHYHHKTVNAATICHIGSESMFHIPGRLKSSLSSSSAYHQLLLSSSTSLEYENSFNKTELSSLLSWACPGITFPSHLGRHKYRDINSGQTIKIPLINKNRNKNRLNVSSARSNMNKSVNHDQSQKNSVSMSSLQMSGISTTNTSTNASALDIAALSFSSPYAHEMVTKLTEKGQKLHDKNAYIPRYMDVGVDKNDISECLEYLNEILTATD